MVAKSDVMVKLALVFFISLLSFSIGTFVGKKYSDNQHKLAALEPSKGGHDSREVASEHGEAKEHGAAKTGEAMSDEEIAKLAEEFVSDDTTATVAHGEAKAEGHGEAKAEGHGEAKAEGHGEAAEHSTAVAANTASHEEAATPKTRTLDRAEPLSAAKNLASGRAVSAAVAEEKKIEARVPTSIPKDVAQYNSAGKFTVQVGAYGREEEAQKTIGELKSKGFSAFYVPATVKGRTWYRVSVGL
ncbi:MAG: SPOR domain-containing protein, partial [Proteobacteria bacterium]